MYTVCTEPQTWASFFHLVVFASIEKIYQALKEVCNEQILKHLKVCQKYSPTHCTFDSLLDI